MATKLDRKKKGKSPKVAPGQRPGELDRDAPLSTGTKRQRGALESPGKVKSAPSTRRKKKKSSSKTQPEENEFKRGMRISTKLIGVSSFLIATVIFLFALMNSWQSNKIIDDATRRLQTTITAGLQQAGTAQLRLLAETTRITLLENETTQLDKEGKEVELDQTGKAITALDPVQGILINMVKNDDRVTEVAVVSTTDIVLAHNFRNRVGSKAKGFLKQNFPAIAMWVKSGVMAGGQQSITFAYPVEDNGNRLCNVFLAYSLYPLDAELQRAEERKKKVISSNIRRTGVVGLLFVLLGMVLTIIQGIRISRPIQALASYADQIAGGDLNARVSIRTHDEIGLLGVRFNSMAERVQLLMHETIEKASMDKEIEVASAVQSTLVPDASLVEEKGINLAGHFTPAARCGGDWWSYFNLADDKLLVVIGDVTGHGVGAAMVTAAAKGAASTMVASAKGTLDTKTLLQAMNAAIYDTARGMFFMTCFASIYDPHQQTLSIANAAHNFPYRYDAEAKDLDALVIRGNRLGEASQMEVHTREIQVKSGDMLVWYTDGLVECENRRGQEFGERRFRAAIRDVAHMPPDRARDEIIGKAHDFYNEVPQRDDITLVIAKIC